MQRFFVYSLTILLVIVSTGPVWSQPEPRGEGGDRRPRGERSSDDGERRGGEGGNWRGGGGGGGGGGNFRGGFGNGQRPQFDPKAWAERLDKNKDGVLTPDETQQARRFIERPLEQAGLSVDRPIPVQKFVEAMSNSFQRRDGDRDRERERSSDSTDKPSETRRSSVPGFGTSDSKVAKVPDFGSPPVGERQPGSGTGSGSVSASERRSDGGSARPSGPDAPDPKQTRAYAQSLINQYDTDKNGMLEKKKGEWDTLKPERYAADTNHDDVITLEEMTIHLSGFASKSESASSGPASRPPGPGGPGGGGGERGSRRSAGGGRPASSASSDQKEERKSYRGLTPAERLPKGLPDWFTRNDEDGDGQIKMSEFAATWSNSKAEEFAKYDLDGDGFITVKECLKVSEKMEKKDKK